MSNFRETEFPVRIINYVNRDLSERLSDVEDDEDVSVNQEAEKLLWVEKFAPRTYTDLLSEEVGWERKKGVGKGGQKGGEGDLETV